MTTEQTAQQLELAAQILRTGHPWGYRRIAGSRYKYNTPIEVVADGNLLIPLLATPTDNRPIHNPDGLTADQVGIGYRLFLTSEKPNTHVKLQEKWKVDEWVPSGVIYADPLTPESNTYRLPLSVPWPEPEKPDPYSELKAAHAAGKVIQILNHQNRYVDADPTWTSPVEYYRIKPDAPPFQLSDQAQLPPPPPGMQWHRTDGWKEGDLPSGYRPHVQGEADADGDEQRMCDNTWRRVSACTNIGSTKVNNHRRTTRPLIFEHAGKTWTWHRPGDPRPCDGDRKVSILRRDDPTTYSELGTNSTVCGRQWAWEDDTIIGWRYAETQTTKVPLGPEDVPPGSVFRSNDQPTTTFWTVAQVWEDGFYLRGESMPWDTARKRMQINRSLPLTGKWNPDAWEPCSKIIPA